MLLHFAVLTGTVLLLAHLLPGVRITSTKTAALVALVFAGLNWVVGWLVTFLVGTIVFIPAILTFGLAFLLVPLLVNIVLLWITDKLLDAFEIRDGRTLLIAGAGITLANGIVGWIGR
jgi:uncharacterized membrane protein YvlD (DUF360 family)